MYLQLFHSVQDDRWSLSSQLQLVGVVCYYGKHYSTFFFHSKMDKWIYFDDATVKEVNFTSFFDINCHVFVCVCVCVCVRVCVCVCWLSGFSLRSLGTQTVGTCVTNIKVSFAMSQHKSCFLNHLQGRSVQCALDKAFQVEFPAFQVRNSTHPWDNWKSSPLHNTVPPGWWASGGQSPLWASSREFLCRLVAMHVLGNVWKEDWRIEGILRLNSISGTCNNWIAISSQSNHDSCVFHLNEK